MDSIFINFEFKCSEVLDGAVPVICGSGRGSMVRLQDSEGSDRDEGEQGLAAQREQQHTVGGKTTTLPGGCMATQRSLSRACGMW